MRYWVVLVFIISSCVHYPITLPFKGFMRVTYTDCGPERSIVTENVLSYYYCDVDMMLTTTTASTHKMQSMLEKELNLIKGDKTIIVVYGYYSPNTYDLDAINHSYLLCAEFDLSLKDTMNIGYGLTKTILYHEANGFLYSASEGTTDLVGYLTIDNSKHDTLCGHINIKGNVYQFFSSTADMSKNANCNCIRFDIIFRAIKQQMDGDSKVLSRFFVPTDMKIDLNK